MNKKGCKEKEKTPAWCRNWIDLLTHYYLGLLRSILGATDEFREQCMEKKKAMDLGSLVNSC